MQKKDNCFETVSLKAISLWDHHGHLSWLGAKKEKIDLTKVVSSDALYSILKKEITKRRKGEWIFGFGLNLSLWGKDNTDIKILDKIASENPLFLERIDAHSAVVNSLTMKLAGLNPKKKEKGGFYEKSGGKLTGGIVDSLCEKVILASSNSPKCVIEKKFLLAIKELKKNCLSGATDMMITKPESEALKEMDKTDKLELPILGYLKWSKDSNIPDFLYKGKKYVEDGIKVFLDGALGSRGASLKIPYFDDPKNSGVLLLDKNEIFDLIDECNRKNVNIAFHIIGDRALEEFLCAIEKFSSLKIKIRAEHLQVTPKPLLKRLKKTDVIFSLQPCHYLSDKKWAQNRLGKERMLNSYLLKSLISEKRKYLFGTDFPIEKVDPKRTIKGCIERKSGEEISIRKALIGMRGPTLFKKYFRPCIISFKLNSRENKKISEIEIKYKNGSN